MYFSSSTFTADALVELPAGRLEVAPEATPLDPMLASIPGDVDELACEELPTGRLEVAPEATLFEPPDVNCPIVQPAGGMIPGFASKRVVLEPDSIPRWNS